jgi:superfamily I DNA/RNA helicase
VDPNQHDKANNWARNKKIDWNIVTGAIQIFNTNVEEFTERIEKKTDNSSQPRIFENYTEEELKTLGVPNDWISAVIKIRNEDDLLDMSDALPEDAWNNLSILLDGTAEKEILIAQLKAEISEKPSTLEEQLRIQPDIYISSDFEELTKILRQDISMFRLWLHPSQKTYAFGSFGGPQKLIGSAGTGKTVVAINRAKFLAENQVEGDKPIFFTTYTKALISNIKSILEAENISNQKVYVSTIHSFALKYGKRLELFPKNIEVLVNENSIKHFWRTFCLTHPEHQAYDADFLRLEYEKVLQQFFVCTEQDYLNVARRGRGEGVRQEERKKLWAIFQDYEAYQQYKKTYSFSGIIFRLTKYLKLWPEYRPFKHIICDEIQDFNNNEMRLLRYLVLEGPNDLFLCGDPFQNIYKRNLRFIDSGINIRGNRSNKLKVNYRTTEEIRQKAISVIEDYIFEDFSGLPATFSGDTSLISGSNPIVHLFNSEQEFQEFITSYIKESFGQLGLHEICICHRTDKGISEIEDVLNKARIPWIRLKGDAINNLNDLTGKVVLSTMHNLKGLEFKNLIVSGFDKKNFPHKPRGFAKWPEEEQRDHLKAEHALHYVAFSRAISSLIITGIGKVPQL